MASILRAAAGSARFWLLAMGTAPVVAPTAALGQEALVVRRLSFQGNRALDDLTLANAIETTNSSAFATLPVLRAFGLGAKRYLSERALERDAARIRLLYRISGFLEVAVDTAVRRTAEDVYITFLIREGRPVVLRRLTIAGLDSVPEGAALARGLPLKVGDPFNRDLLRAAADTIANRLRDRGRPLAAVFLADRLVDSAAYRAEVSLTVSPGPRMTVGEIRVEGARDARESVVIRNFLATAPGRLYRQSDLFQSQRNLVLSDLYRFASVDIDSAAFRSPEGRVPILIRVVPGSAHRVSASFGYGTDDCFRNSLGWTGRNVLGRGRILDLSARFSKLGVGDPADLGFEDNFLCSRLRSDSVGSSRLNYAVSTAVRRPGFFGAANQLALSLFAERGSQFGVFAREEQGGGVVLSRETSSRIPVALGYRLAFGTTRANDVNFCAYFNACTASDIGVLRDRQRQGVVSLTASRFRVDNVLDPGRGNAAVVQVAFSATATGSEPLQRFFRISGDVSVYQPIGRSSVLAGRVRAGLLGSPTFTPTGPGGEPQEPVRYVPPEQRFYAGGPNDVRGFDGNQLGPVVYVILDTAAVTGTTFIAPNRVTVSPVGGNRVLVGNLEARFPSPIFHSRIRLAAFVDAGTVWEANTSRGAPVRIRATPGLGVRFATPLGPARLDLAYNPYDFPPGDLYQSRPDGSLQLVRSGFVKPRSPGVTVHFAVGQAF